MDQVQNAIDFLKMIGALDEKENLTNLGESIFSVLVAWFVMCLWVCFMVISNFLFPFSFNQGVFSLYFQ